MTYVPVNFEDKFSKFKAQWSPKVVARMNDYQFKLVRVEGEFVWHDHPDTDETFMVIDGELEIKFRDGSLTLKSGEMFVVPRGLEHCPVALKECRIMVIEPASVVNTGDKGGKLTADNDVWI